MQLQWQQPQSCCWSCATFISWTYFLYFLYFMLILPEVVSNLCVRAREGWTEYGFVIGCNSMIVSWLFCFVLFCWVFLYHVIFLQLLHSHCLTEEQSLCLCTGCGRHFIAHCDCQCLLLYLILTAAVFLFSFSFLFFAVLCACAGAKEREQEKKEGR